jgi:ABC-2 type transport system permease protein
MSIGIFFVMGNLALGTLILDYQYNWQQTVRSLPISTRQLVIAKYLLLLMAIVAACAVSAIVAAVIVIVFNLFAGIGFVAIAMGISTTLMFCAIMFPVLFRFGPAKMQLAMITFVAVIFLAFMIGGRLGLAGLVYTLLTDIWIIAIMLIAISLLLAAASIPLSIRLVNAAFRHQ